MDAPGRIFRPVFEKLKIDVLPRHWSGFKPNLLIEAESADQRGNATCQRPHPMTRWCFESSSAPSQNTNASLNENTRRKKLS